MSDRKPPGKAIQGGFIMLRPTQATKSLWNKVLLQLEGVMKAYGEAQSREYIENIGSEQLMLGELLDSEPIELSWMDQYKFVPGVWYNDEGTTFTPPFRLTIYDPVVILNNWVIGNSAKIARAKLYGHWFLNDEQDMCIKTIEKNVYPPGGLHQYMINRFGVAIVAMIIFYSLYLSKHTIFKWVLLLRDRLIRK